MNLEMFKRLCVVSRVGMDSRSSGRLLEAGAGAALSDASGPRPAAVGGWFTFTSRGCAANSGKVAAALAGAWRLDAAPGALPQPRIAADCYSNIVLAAINEIVTSEPTVE